ncbi:MAG: hypothetical protein ABFR75_10440 [Acidobacteriota bacterium]
MKKKYLIFLLIVLFSVSMFSQSVSVKKSNLKAAKKKIILKCNIKVLDPCPEGSTVTLKEKKATLIRWDPSFSPGGNVKIAMTYANCPGESGPVLLILFPIVQSTPNDGSFTWTTPDVNRIKCYKISIYKIGTKCSGRTGIIKVKPDHLFRKKILSANAIKVKYKNQINSLVRTIMKMKPNSKIKFKVEEFLKHLSKTEGSGQAENRDALKILEEQLQKEMAEQEKNKAEQMIQSQREHIKKLMQMIKEMMERQSEAIRKISH